MAFSVFTTYITRVRNLQIKMKHEKVLKRPVKMICKVILNTYLLKTLPNSVLHQLHVGLYHVLEKLGPKVCFKNEGNET